MKISTKGRYALRLMADLAIHADEGYIALKDVAERQDISKKYLELIVPTLTKSGYLTANRGYQGGYKLGMNPSDITAGAVLRLTENSLQPVACLDEGAPVCPREAECMTLPLWKGLSKVINDYLDSVTLQDIIDNRHSDGGDYCI